eukprot:CAMPEP_0198365718 /NCGR_PEP_ID=MMETSP1450-20131203/154316_1 /TAXON_ID=753684 ORGANISM="Madagascaria erythrocladiodes, Strain CCMP3234" /NCGR_SAMPLE_ID=MMETSP1450 /ASSEMBLY_ACC=CAM_ASM_001115 /LENGTH=42 /DNA_ID= /DNA_START= /DNA_END= /DNA_ORIENTATION=
MTLEKWEDAAKLKRLAHERDCEELLSNFAPFTLAGFVKRYGV